MEALVPIFLIVGLTYLIMNYFNNGCWIGNKESKFKAEKCPCGLGHTIRYSKWGNTYQKCECIRCGKFIIVEG